MSHNKQLKSDGRLAKDDNLAAFFISYTIYVLMIVQIRCRFGPSGINVDCERQTSTPDATAGFLDCLCSGVMQHDRSLITLSLHLTQIPNAPTRLHALQLSRYLWIEAITHVLASCKCPVNIPRDTICHGFSDTICYSSG